MIRSWLFASATNEKKLARLAMLGADAVVLDLAEGVADDAKADARRMAAEWLDNHQEKVVSQRNFMRWVRINGLDTPHWRDDLVAVLPGKIQGIILPRAQGPQDVAMVAAEIYELEQRNRLTHGSVSIIPQVGETPSAALRICNYAEDPHPRLAGLSWSAPGLATALGATRMVDENGQWSDPMRHVRAATLLTARSRGLMAIDTSFANQRDAESMPWAAKASRADGFTGMQALHPRQVRVINDAFAPSAADLADAREIVDLFAGNPTAETLPLGERTIDKRQLDQARTLLQLHED